MKNFKKAHNIHHKYHLFEYLIIPQQFPEFPFTFFNSGLPLSDEVHLNGRIVP